MLLHPPASTTRRPKLNQVLTVSSLSPLVIFNPIPSALPPNLGELANRLAARAEQIGFFPECVKARGLPDLQQLNLTSHRAAAMLNRARQHGLPISLPRGMSEEELRTALHYGSNSSAKKEVDFFHQEMADQVQAGHIIISPLETVRDLPQLWIFPVAAIPQVGRRPRLIFDFTWSSLNEYTAGEAPKEVMRFGGTLYHIIRRILQSGPQLVPVYLGKVDLHTAVGTPRGHSLCSLLITVEEAYRQENSGFTPGYSHGLRGQTPLLLNVHGNNSGHGK